MVFDQSLRKYHDGGVPAELFCFQQGTFLVLPLLLRLGHETKITLVAQQVDSCLMWTCMLIHTDKISKNNWHLKTG